MPSFTPGRGLAASAAVKAPADTDLSSCPYQDLAARIRAWPSAGTSDLFCVRELCRSLLLSYLIHELLRGVRAHPLVSVAVSSDPYSVGYSAWAASPPHSLHASSNPPSTYVWQGCSYCRSASTTTLRVVCSEVDSAASLRLAAAPSDDMSAAEATRPLISGASPVHQRKESR
jgi:hypothetical protein